jgi:hypothetical protein
VFAWDCRATWSAQRAPVGTMEHGNSNSTKTRSVPCRMTGTCTTGLRHRRVRPCPRRRNHRCPLCPVRVRFAHRSSARRPHTQLGRSGLRARLRLDRPCLHCRLARHHTRPRRRHCRG